MASRLGIASPVIVFVTRMSIASSPIPAVAVALSVTSDNKIESMLLERSRALLPAMRLEIPIDRLAIVANVDAGIIVKLPQTFQVRKNLFGAPGGLRLGKREQRIGRRDRQYFDVETVRGRDSTSLGLHEPPA